MVSVCLCSQQNDASPYNPVHPSGETPLETTPPRPPAPAFTLVGGSPGGSWNPIALPVPLVTLGAATLCIELDEGEACTRTPAREMGRAGTRRGGLPHLELVYLPKNYPRLPKSRSIGGPPLSRPSREGRGTLNRLVPRSSFQPPFDRVQAQRLSPSLHLHPNDLQPPCLPLPSSLS